MFDHKHLAAYLFLTAWRVLTIIIVIIIQLTFGTNIRCMVPHFQIDFVTDNGVVLILRKVIITTGLKKDNRTSLFSKFSAFKPSSRSLMTDTTQVHHKLSDFKESRRPLQKNKM